jgi:hypothetical protein
VDDFLILDTGGYVGAGSLRSKVEKGRDTFSVTWGVEIVISSPALVCFVLEWVRMGTVMDPHMCSGRGWKVLEVWHLKEVSIDER